MPSFTTSATYEWDTFKQIRKPLYDRADYCQRHWKEENAKNHDKISKYLSYILRHKPESINLILDNYGWANIDELIDKTNEFSLTRKMIDEVVTRNDKQRFTIKKDHIRANQGHSIAVDLELKVKKPNDVLYHGTATRFLDSILKLGILPAP